ncbi:hypothetical protein EV178_002654 [Coemansia sp. RSA 1646]|nr:hypothetical protein EV178_002654 [Coemansia sp. RSA 1646]
MKYFNRFSASIAHQPLFKVGNHTHYGGLVRNLDLSMLGGRWEKIGYVQLAPVLAFCTNITSLDLDLCQHIGDSHFLKLFVDNPHLSEKLTHLDLDEVMLMDQTIGAIIRMLPKLKYLHLSETNAGPLTCKAIGSCLTDLQYLELSRCIDIDDSCIETIAEKCKSLSYLKIQGCDNIITDDVEELMLERDNLATISEGSDDNYESDDNIDDIGDGFGGSIVGVLSRNTNLLGRYRFDDNDIDID